MNRRLLFFCLFINFLSFAQLSDEKNKLIQPLAKIDYAESSSVGYGGDDSKIFSAFEKMKSSLTNEDLLILCKNSSNALRLYSCFELIKRSEPYIVSIYQYYREFPLTMRYTQGCVGNYVDIADMIFKEYDRTYSLNNYAKEQLKELPKSDPIYKEWEKVFSETKKLLNEPNFVGAFERIKDIKQKFDKIK